MDIVELRQISEPDTVYECLCGHIIEKGWKGEFWHLFDNGSEEAVHSKKCKYCDCNVPIVKSE